MDTDLREQMLASATDAVNALCTWAHDKPIADFGAREERVLELGARCWPRGWGSWPASLGYAARRVRSALFTR
ncbi:MAG: hypothetical protein JOZ81_24030 [Chloroflexi bacterium]|nr:hypothetical protein [Chloroflexota bacterium]